MESPSRHAGLPPLGPSASHRRSVSPAVGLRTRQPSREQSSSGTAVPEGPLTPERESISGGTRRRTTASFFSKNEEDDEDDLATNRAQSHEITFRINALRSSLSSRMREIVKSRKASASPLDRESKEHGVDLDALRDIKAVFDSTATGTNSKGQKGIVESEFIRVFAPQLCIGMSDEEMRGMFRSIDKDCSGAVSWQEISNFLVGYTSGIGNGLAFGGNDAPEKLFSPEVIEGRPAHHKSHSHIITDTCYIPGADALFSGSTDGVVRCWNPSSLKSAPTPVHVGGGWITGLVHIPTSGRLLILQSDRIAVICNVGSAAAASSSSSANSGGNNATDNGSSEFAVTDIYRAYGSLGPAIERGIGGVPVFKRGPSRRKVPGETKTPVSIPVTLLPASNTSERTTCCDHVQPMAAGESVAIGFEDGYVNTFYLHQSDKPLQPTQQFKPHNQLVSQICFAPELEGFLSSSTDGFVKLTNVEKNMTLQTMSSAPTSGVKRRPVMSFDYCKAQGNVLGFGCGRTIQIWNALSGVRHAVVNDLDNPLVRLCFNPTKPYMYALTEQKTIRVYDTRTWKPFEVLQDTAPRYPEDSLGCLRWIENHGMLVSGASELIAWTTSDVQERLDAGVAPNTTAAGGADEADDGHIYPILNMHFAPNSSYIYTIDIARCICWSMQRFTSLWSFRWKIGSGSVTCTDLEAGELKFLVGTDNGTVLWVNAACGGITNHLNHNIKGEISCVSHFAHVTSTSSCSFAACGLDLMMWSEEARNSVPQDAPTLATKLGKEFGSIVALGRSGLDGSVCLVGCANGAVFAINALTLATLFIVPPPSKNAAVDSLHTFHPGCFAVAYSNSNLRFFGFVRDTAAIPAAFFRGASSRTETITTTTSIPSKNLMVAGDTAGVVSVFRLTRLLNPTEMKLKLLPARQGGACSESSATSSFVDLLYAWEAHHNAPCTGVDYIPDKKLLISTGGDRRVKAWNLGTESASLVADFGRDLLSLPLIDPEEMLTPHQFTTSFQPHDIQSEQESRHQHHHRKHPQQQAPTKLGIAPSPIMSLSMEPSNAFSLKSSTTTTSHILPHVVEEASMGVVDSNEGSKTFDQYNNFSSIIPHITTQSPMMGGVSSSSTLYHQQGSGSVASSPPPREPAAAGGNRARTTSPHRGDNQSASFSPTSAEPEGDDRLSSKKLFELATRRTLELKRHLVPTSTKTFGTGHSVSPQLNEIARLKEQRSEGQQSRMGERVYFSALNLPEVQGLPGTKGSRSSGRSRSRPMY